MSVQVPNEIHVSLNGMLKALQPSHVDKSGNDCAKFFGRIFKELTQVFERIENLFKEHRFVTKQEKIQEKMHESFLSDLGKQLTVFKGKFQEASGVAYHAFMRELDHKTKLEEGEAYSDLTSNLSYELAKMERVCALLIKAKILNINDINEVKEKIHAMNEQCKEQEAVIHKNMEFVKNQVREERHVRHAAREERHARHAERKARHAEMDKAVQSESVQRESARETLVFVRNNIVNKFKNQIPEENEKLWGENLNKLDRVIETILLKRGDYKALANKGQRYIKALCKAVGLDEVPKDIYPVKITSEREALVKNFRKIHKNLLTVYQKIPKEQKANWHKQVIELKEFIEEMRNPASDYLNLAHKARQYSVALYNVAYPKKALDLKAIDQVLQKAEHPVTKQAQAFPFEKDMAVQLDDIRKEIVGLPTKKQFLRDVKVGVGILLNEYKINLKALEKIIAKLNTGTATNWDSLLEQGKMKIKALYEAKGLKTPENRFEGIDQIIQDIAEY